MVNFLRQQQPGGNRVTQKSGNRTSDLLREHLANSAAQRISAAYGNRDQQVAPEPELIEPSFFRNMAPAIGKLVEHSTGQEIEKRQQARDLEAQQSATDELANIYAAELDIPIERARLIASAPPEARKEVIKDIVSQRKEERGFENKLALEGIKQENKYKLADHKVEAKAKFAKDDPNRQWYQQGITATQNLNKLSKSIPYDPEGYFDKWGYERKDEERVRNWITMAVAAATPIAHLSVDQQKKLEADYLEQYYTRGKREQVIEQLEGTFNPANFESIQERGLAMSQQREQGNQPQNQEQTQGQEQQQPRQQPTQLEQPDMAQERSLLGEVGDTAARGVLRGTANIAERLEGALKMGTTLPWTASLHAAEFVAPYLPEFAQKAVELNRQLYNLIQPPTVEDIKAIHPEAAKALEPHGRIDRIIDSVTREVPEMAIAWGTGGAVVKPLVQGLLGGLSDEWLEAQKAPEIVKLGARLLTSIGTTGAINAYKAKSALKPQPIMTKLSKVVRDTASTRYEEAKHLGDGVIVDTMPIKIVQSKLNGPGAGNAIKDKAGFKNLKNVLHSFQEIKPEPTKLPTLEAEKSYFESFGKRVTAEAKKYTPKEKELNSVKVTLPTLFQGYRDLGKLERKETDEDLRNLTSLAKKAVWEAIQKTTDQGKKASESVLKWNMANEGWAATEKVTGLERMIQQATEKYPGLSKSVILGALPAFLGFGHLLGTERALLLGGAAGITAGAGALKRQLSYLKRPEVQKLFMEFLETGLAEDVGQTARNYRDIVDGFKKSRNSKQS